MKKLLAFSILAMFVLCIPAIADQTKPTEKTDHAKGTISAWDEGSKSFKVKDKDDKEWSFSWNDATKVHGTPKVGESVRVEYTKDKDGNALATRVWAGKEAMGKAEGKKD